MKIYISTGRAAKQGFALVATLSLMALVILLAIALLALAGGSAATTNSSRLRMQAQANARLALAAAVAQLQKETGDDRRITATAAVLDNEPGTAEPDGVAEPYWVGAWNSWTFDPTRGGSPNIERQKEEKFRRWLVSGLSEEEATRRSLATEGNPFRNNPRGVRLVGPGSTGDPADASKQHLWAGRVALTAAAEAAGGSAADATATRAPAGHGAYAVMDEGVKARIDFNASTERSRAGLPGAPAGAPARTAFEKADDPAKGGSLAAFAASRDRHDKITNLESASFAAGGAVPYLGGYLHDLTTASAGVLADVANGGLRKDLSLFMETQQVPSDYAARRLYSDNTQPLGQQGASSSLGYNAGAQDPSWKFIHSQLRAPRSLGQKDNLPLLMPVLPPDDLFLPFEKKPPFRMSRGVHDALPMGPVILRCDVIFSLFAKRTHGPWPNAVTNAFAGSNGWDYMLHLIYAPVVTLWNPYNVPLEINGAQVEIENPPLGFNFIRSRSPEQRHIGPVLNQIVPLDEMFVNAGQKYNKRFIMTLYGGVSGSSPSGPVRMQPGEVLVFSPYMEPTGVWNSGIFDYQNNLTTDIKAAPGWRGPQYGYNIDWLTGQTGFVVSPRNGHANNVGVIGSTLNDTWDIEMAPKPQKTAGGQAASRYAVTLRLGPDFSSTISRLEFDYGGSEAALLAALQPTGTNIPESGRVRFPLKLSDYQPPIPSSEVQVSLDLPLRQWRVRPFAVLTAQAKTALDASFPNRPFIHGNATRPLAYVDLRPNRERQEWGSHELAILKYESGMDTEPKLDGFNRGYFFSGSYAFNGSQFGTHRELPVVPPQSVAQLGHIDLAHSGYVPNVDHAVGTSFAPPLLTSGRAVEP
jgi:type II secretory pathway pseudopilin PulG